LGFRNQPRMENSRFSMLIDALNVVLAKETVLQWLFCSKNVKDVAAYGMQEPGLEILRVMVVVDNYLLSLSLKSLPQ
jgi:hypothetical protein